MSNLSPEARNRRLDDAQVGGDHYASMEITPWEFLGSCLTPAELRGYFKGEAIVYIAREAKKAGDVDISKARHVLQKLEEINRANPQPQPGDPRPLRDDGLGKFFLGYSRQQIENMAQRLRTIGADPEEAATLLEALVQWLAHR